MNWVILLLVTFQRIPKNRLLVCMFLWEMDHNTWNTWRNSEENVMSDYNECVPSAVKKAMATMTDMGFGMLSEYDILVKTRRFFVHAVTLDSIMITVNSCGFNKSIFKKYMKNMSGTKSVPGLFLSTSALF